MADRPGRAYWLSCSGDDRMTIQPSSQPNDRQWGLLYPNGVRTICTSEAEARRIASYSTAVVQSRTVWQDADDQIATS